MVTSLWTSCLCVFCLCCETTMLRVSKKDLLSQVILLLTCCLATLFQDNVSQFLKENVLQTISRLREKYEGCDTILRKEQQVRE